MIIGIDARFAIGKKRGIGNYTFNLITHLVEIDKINKYILYIDKSDVEQVLPKQANVSIRKLKPSIYPLWEQFSLPAEAKKDNVNILHCTGNTFPFLTKNKFKIVTTIHDVMFLKKAFRSGSLYQFLGNKYRAFIVSNFSYLPSSVVTVSDFSKHDILNTVRTLTPEKVFRTYQSYDSVFDELDKNESEMIIKNKLSISYPYILALGAVEPRKNTHAIIEVFARLKKKREIEQKLVIVGIPQNNHHFFHGLINSLNVQQDILLTNFISTKTLSALYQCSTMFLYPSLYEGFGIPLLEAMASGTPIITSNITSIPEVVGDAGILIDPTNLKQMEMSMVKLIDDQSLRLDLIAKGFKQVTNFSWQNMAKQTLEVYNIAYKR